MGAALEYVNRHDCHGAGRIEHGRQDRAHRKLAR
jgi:hypothetical protein